MKWINFLKLLREIFDDGICHVFQCKTDSEVSDDFKDWLEWGDHPDERSPQLGYVRWLVGMEEAFYEQWLNAQDPDLEGWKERRDSGAERINDLRRKAEAVMFQHEEMYREEQDESWQPEDTNDWI